MVGEGGAHQLTRRGRGVGGIRIAVGAEAVLHVHPAGQQIGRRDAVGEGVMNLAQDRDPATRETLDQVHLPERPAAVQRGAGQSTDRLVEFAAPARGFHPARADVVFEVDFGVLPPHRVMELQRDVDQFIAERVELVEPAVDDLPQFLDPETGPAQSVEFDHRQFQRVHVHVGGFAVQQHGVPPAKPFHRDTSLEASYITSLAPRRLLFR